MLVALSAVYAVILLAVLPQMLVQDSWLALVSGREIVTNGLPHTDTFTVWTQGVEWIDQQWLAQVAFYGLFTLGGVELALLAHVGLLVVAFASALAAARSLGASTRSVCLVGMLCMFAAPWGLQLRAQTFAIPLFVWLLWLLAADSRAPSRRVFLVLPILVLWANLHGTVVLAALLVAARGVTYGVAELRKPARSAGWARRTALLTVLPFACLFASPYGLELAGYYRTMLVSPLMRTFVDEWGASVPSANTMLFYVVGIATAALLARHRSRLSGFEQLALLVMLIAGVSAIRSIVWFSFAALILLPCLLDGALSQWSRRLGRTPRRVLASAALGAALVATCVVAAQPPLGPPVTGRGRRRSRSPRSPPRGRRRRSSPTRGTPTGCSGSSRSWPGGSPTTSASSSSPGNSSSSSSPTRAAPAPTGGARSTPTTCWSSTSLGSRSSFVHCAPARPTRSPTATTRSRFSLAAGSGPSDEIVTVVT